MNPKLVGYFIVLLCLGTFDTSEASLSSERCPCRFDTNTSTADCSWVDYSTDKLQKVPSCVPDTVKRLGLYFNNITYNKGQFQKFGLLTYLDLAWNENFIPQNDSFSKLQYLQVLFLNYTNLKSLRTSLFIEPINLEQLSLEGTGLRSYYPDLFNNIHGLKYLDLSFQDKLYSVSRSPFAALNELRFLILKTNFNLHLFLHKGLFAGLNKLVRLDLKDSVLGFLTRDLFNDLPNLTELDLSGNSLNHIENYQFASLPNLRQLELGGSSYVKLYAHSFAGLANLTFLSMKGDRQYSSTAFPLNVFEPLINLEELILEECCTLAEGFFQCKNLDTYLNKCPSLKKLYLDNFVIKSLGAGFMTLTKLKSLHFRDHQFGSCQLKSLNSLMFENLSNAPISHLVLGEYDIDFIRPNAFSNFRSLTYLEFRRLNLPYWCNQPDAIETGLQNSNITHLRFHITCNDLRWRSIGAMIGLNETQLETLEIYSDVSHLGEGFFYSLPLSLKHLEIVRNRLDSADFDGLHTLENLVKLDLSDQKKRIPPTAQDSMNMSAASTDRLSSATIEYNYQRNSDCEGMPQSLEILDISRSSLFYVAGQLFCDPDNSLKVLNVADQYFKYPFQEKYFKSIWKILKNFKRLEQLDLSGNRLKSIPTDALSHLQNLKQLNLMRNAIGPVVYFKLQTNVLKTLNFLDNVIAYLSESFRDQLSKFSSLSVDLHNNTLLCDCDRFDFVEWMCYTDLIYKKDKLICESKPDTKYPLRNISQLHQKFRYACTVKEVTYGCVALFIFQTLCISLAYVAWYKRWKFRYLLAVGRKTLYPFHPIERRRIELEYDVYISYERDFDVTQNQTLHELVSQVVYPELQRRGYKVMIRDELEPGSGLYHAISHTVQRAKKVVSMISKDYCNDYWNVFEFNAAVLEGIYTKRQIIIPIAFEEIRREHLHAEMFAFLKAASVAYRTPNVTDEMLVDYICDTIRDNREFGE